LIQRLCWKANEINFLKRRLNQLKMGNRPVEESETGRSEILEGELRKFTGKQPEFRKISFWVCAHLEEGSLDSM